MCYWSNAFCVNDNLYYTKRAIMENKLITYFLFAYILAVHGFPNRLDRHYNLNYLNATSILGTLANTQSNAAATGLGSSVEISGFVTGETSGASDVESTPHDTGSSSISSQVNCSEYSSSSASGGLTADALTSGDCLMVIDDTGSHHYQTGAKATSGRSSGNKVEIGMEGQVNSQGQQSGNPDAPQGSSITQATSQNPADGSAQGYQLVSGPNTASTFSGVMAHATQGDLVQGTQETLMTHASGDTSIQSLVTPFGPAVTIPA